MPINTASPQDTYDHMFGSGATSYSWWQGPTRTTGVDETSKASDDWSVEVTCEGEDREDITKMVNHAAVLKAARKFVQDPPRGSTNMAIQDARDLVFDADACDFDAGTADELLQFIVLGEVVFC